MVALKVIDVYSLLTYREVDRERVSYRFIRAMIKKLTNRFGGRVDIIPKDPLSRNLSMSWISVRFTKSTTREMPMSSMQNI